MESLNNRECLFGKMEGDMRGHMLQIRSKGMEYLQQQMVKNMKAFGLKGAVTGKENITFVMVQ